MTHAHDRTMLARLGFADPDKRNGLHDELCAYLATKDASVDAVRAIGRRLGWFKPRQCGYEVHASTVQQQEALAQNPGGLVRVAPENDYRGVWYACPQLVEPNGFQNPRTQLEEPLTKGHGQYAATLGFLDVTYSGIQVYGTCSAHDGQQGLLLHRERAPAFRGPGYQGSDLRAVFEVKAGHVSPSEVLRQIKFYRSYTTAHVWAVFTGFKYPASDVALLEKEGVLAFCAGAKFEAWQKARREAQAEGGEEL